MRYILISILKSNSQYSNLNTQYSFSGTKGAIKPIPRHKTRWAKKGKKYTGPYRLIRTFTDHWPYARCKKSYLNGAY